MNLDQKLLVIGLIVAVMGILIPIINGKYRVYARVKNLKKSGTFRRPEIIVKILTTNKEFQINQQDRSVKKIFSLIYVCKDVFKGQEHFFIDFKVLLHNIGEKDLLDVKVCFQFAPGCYYAVPDGVLTWNLTPPIIQTKREFKENNEGKFSIHYIEKISPTVELSISEMLRYQPSDSKHTLITRSKDNIPMRVSYSIQIAYQFYLIISSKDRPPEKYKIELQFYNSDNFENFAQGYITTKLQKKEAELLKTKETQSILEFMFTKWIFIESKKEEKELFKYKDKNKDKNITFISPTNNFLFYQRGLEDYSKLYKENVDLNIFDTKAS